MTDTARLSPTLRPDLLAGLTVWAVLVPESLAYATIAGVAPVVGLYAAVPALALYLVLGTSRNLVVAPMSATAALSASIALSYAAPDPTDYLRVTVTLALVTGVVGLVAGFVRLGFVASFISEPVLKGFVVGLALTIVVGQVDALLGLPESDAEGFLARVGRMVLDLPDLHPATAALGLGSLAVVLVLRRVAPVVPGSLLVVVLGIALSASADLADRGVSVVGPIESGLPTVGLPGSAPSEYTELLVPAAGLLLVAFAEGLAAARAFAGTEHRIDPSRELSAIGLSNLGSGLVGGMVVNGSLSKTAVAASAGARSQVANLVASALVVVTLLFLTGLFEMLPHAVLAAVVIAAVVELVDLGALRRLYAVGSGALARLHPRTARADFIAAVGALVGVLVLDVLPGLLLGVVLSLLLLLQHASHPHVARLARLPGEQDVWLDLDREPDLSPEPDVVVVRVEGPLFFGNALHVADRIAELAGDTPRVVIDAGAIASIDVTAAETLEGVADRLERAGGLLVVSGGVGQFRDVVTAAGHAGLLLSSGHGLDEAVRAARGRSGGRSSSEG